MVCGRQTGKKGSGVKMKPSGIGGMAVIEGVMMKNKEEYAVAVRKPDNEIAIEKKTHKDFSDKVKLFKLPIFRGMLAFVDSMVIGVKALNFASSFFEEDEDKDKKAKAERKRAKKAAKAAESAVQTAEAAGNEEKKVEVNGELKGESKKEDSNALLMAAAVVISLGISIFLFMVLPVLVSNVFKRIIDSYFWLSVLEAVLRLMIFIGYILVVSEMPDIRRVFMYHGAEHKTINCLENGFELTLENVKWQSKQHKRCGTSFMLLVMLISIVFFIILQPKTLALRILSRILLVPIIAGISYEFIRLAGKSDNVIINILSKPGMWMQALTTKEPVDSMIEVAIQSVDAVFDWRAFLATFEEEEKVTGKKTQTVASGAKVQAVKKPQVVEGTAKAGSSQPVPASKKQAVPAAPRSLQMPKRNEDEDDEILKALDKYLDFDEEKSSRRVGSK